MPSIRVHAVHETFSVRADILKQINQYEECLVYPNKSSVGRRQFAIGEVTKAFINSDKEITFDYTPHPNATPPTGNTVRIFAVMSPLALPWYKKWVNKVWKGFFADEEVIAINGIYYQK